MNASPFLFVFLVFQNFSLANLPFVYSGFTTTARNPLRVCWGPGAAPCGAQQYCGPGNLCLDCRAICEKPTRADCASKCPDYWTDSSTLRSTTGDTTVFGTTKSPAVSDSNSWSVTAIAVGAIGVAALLSLISVIISKCRKRKKKREAIALQSPTNTPGEHGPLLGSADQSGDNERAAAGAESPASQDDRGIRASGSAAAAGDDASAEGSRSGELQTSLDGVPDDTNPTGGPGSAESRHNYPVPPLEEEYLLTFYGGKKKVEAAQLPEIKSRLQKIEWLREAHIGLRESTGTLDIRVKSEVILKPRDYSVFEDYLFLVKPYAAH